VKELVASLGAPFLALNMRDNEWQDPVFEAYKMFEKGGVKGCSPRSSLSLYVCLPSALDGSKLVVRYSGRDIRATVEKARKEGADLVVFAVPPTDSRSTSSSRPGSKAST